MRAVVQRVSEASVVVEGQPVSAIGVGLLVYVGVAHTDGNEDVDYLVDKVCHLRIFPDADEKMNLDVAQARGAVLVVPAFSLQADARKGRRPSFDSAADPDDALALYERFCESLERCGLSVERGKFRAMMDVKSVNAGPICLLLDSRRGF